MIATDCKRLDRFGEFANVSSECLIKEALQVAPAAFARIDNSLIWLRADNVTASPLFSFTRHAPLINSHPIV